MKKYIIIFIGILVLGSLAIYLPHFLSDYQQRKEAAELKSQQDNQDKLFRSMESKKETIDEEEIPFDERESEQYDKTQVYYKNIEALYKYLTFNQVDQVKQKLQFYLTQNLSNVKECNIITETIRDNKQEFTFDIGVEKYKDITVKVTKDSNKQITDISIFQSRMNE